MRRLALLLGLPAAVLVSAPACAAQVSAAVAANFAKPAEELGAAFKAKTGDDVVFSFGATGALYAQITQGAPFEILLSSDSKRPAKAIEDGLGVAGTAFTYAVGKVVLYSPSIDVTDGASALKAVEFQHIAIADPKTAPYGAAAVEAMTALGVNETLSSRLVVGESIAQTLLFVESGSAEVGFVALSQVIRKTDGYQWSVPQNLYSAITQDAVLLNTGEDNPAAKAFLDFLQSDEGRAIIARYGYETR